MQASMEWRLVTEQSPGSGITVTSHGEENLNPLHFNGKDMLYAARESNAL